MPGRAGTTEAACLRPAPGAPVCFAAGTRIATETGEVPVERLRPGDHVLTAHGGALLQPLIWVGRIHVALFRLRERARVAPILFAAGSLGDGAPYRDLRVSPSHALFLGGRLVPAALLVNGSTIVQEAWCRAVTYHHIELERHGLVVAEGAVSETYLDDGNRWLFEDRDIAALSLDFAGQRGNGRYAAGVCAPVLAEGDPGLEIVRRRLAGAMRGTG